MDKSLNHPTFIDIIGLGGSVLLTLSFIPLTYEILLYSRYQKVNIIFQCTVLLSSVLLLIYSVHHNVYPMMIANLSVALNNSITIIAFYIHKWRINTESNLGIKSNYEIP